VWSDDYAWPVDCRTVDLSSAVRDSALRTVCVSGACKNWILITGSISVPPSNYAVRRACVAPRLLLWCRRKIESAIIGSRSSRFEVAAARCRLTVTLVNLSLVASALCILDTALCRQRRSVLLCRTVAELLLFFDNFGFTKWRFITFMTSGKYGRSYAWRHFRLVPNWCYLHSISSIVCI